MAAFLLRSSSSARRFKLIVIGSLLLAGAGASLVARAQGLDGADERELPRRIASTSIPIAAQSAPAQTERPGAGGFADEAAPSAAARYDLALFWAHTDLVARSTLLCLAFMFVGGAYVLLRRSWDQQLVLRTARTVSHGFWTAPNLYEAVRGLESHSAFRAIAEEGLEAANHKEGRLTDRIGASDWIAMSLQRSVRGVHDKLQHGLTFLETVGSTAPFIGAFGTVWGIHRALTASNSAGELAIPVGAALGITAIGLAVAVLARLGYRWLSGRNKTAIDAIRAFAEGIQALLLSADAAADAGQTQRRQHSAALRGTS